MGKILGVKFFVTALIVFFLIYGGIFLFKHTLFTPDFMIKKIIYDSWSIQQFDDPYLYKAISTVLKDENYYVIKWSRGSVIRKIQSQFPIVSDIVITYLGKNTLGVTVWFHEPDMVIKNQDLLFGVYENYTFSIFSGNQIGSGDSVLYLPLYASGLTGIEGLFFRQSAKEIKQQMDLIYAAFPKSKFVAYLPGAERTVIMTNDSKKVFINNLVDISQQLKNFDLLERYYTWYVGLKEIDLGSLEKDKVIVKK